MFQLTPLIHKYMLRFVDGQENAHIIVKKPINIKLYKS